MVDSPSLQPSVLIIFGITGDLAKRKVLPALYNLCKEDLLPEGTKIIGISRRHVPKDEILDTVNLCVLEKDNVCDPEVINRLKSWLSMFQLDPVNDEDYERLNKHLSELDSNAGISLDRLFYLSIPPQVYGPIIAKLGSHGLNKAGDGASTRLMVEKPFGYDIKSAEQLISETEKVFHENQIFRIDHYLAKETAQNILKFRRHNPVFTSQWNCRHIRRIHVIAKEKIGIENRVSFYENVGALRDLVQSHLMQLLALSAMEIPKDLSSDEVHACKHAFMESLIPPNALDGIKSQVIRGQYDTYRQEVGNIHSNTETFVSLVLRSSDPNWKDTVFQLTTGKSLDEKATLIQIYFGDDDPNVLTFRVQPDEGFDINMLIEQPGFVHNLREVKMNFSYNQHFDTDGHDAYERVLVDAIRGDKMLFASKSEVITSWKVLQPVLDAWQTDNSDLKLYTTGSQGPEISQLAKNLSAKLSA